MLPLQSIKFTPLLRAVVEYREAWLSNEENAMYTIRFGV